MGVCILAAYPQQVMGKASIVNKVKSALTDVLFATPLARWLLMRQLRRFRVQHDAQYEANSRLREERIPSQLQAIRERVAAGKPVRVAFLVYTPAIFGLRLIFEAMCQDPAFEPRIIVTPETAPVEDMQRNMERTYAELHAAYGDKVLPIDQGGYDVADDVYPDIREDYDICALSRPYDPILPLHFRMEHLSVKCPCIYSDYGYTGTTWIGVRMYRAPYRALLWRVYAHNRHEADVIQDTNVVMSGRAVNDSFALAKYVPQERKRVILAPHHSLSGTGTSLQLATFLTHADFFLELPKLYPQVDFIFRPHPHLFAKLKTDQYWGPERTDAWLNTFCANPNVKYDMRGNYAEIMVNSDALIHDCSSFTMDYLYTDHPQCYLMRKHVDYRCFLTDFGMDVLSHTYKAYNRKQICEFIEKVVLGGDDPMKEERLAFADAEIKIGYPGVHQKIMAHMREEFGIPAPKA